MLYEPPKTKKYIIIFGVVAFFLAVLAIVAAPLIYKNKKQSQVPALSLEERAKQENLQKDAEKMINLQKNQNDSLSSLEQLQKDASRLIEESKKINNGKSPEELQKDSEKLIKALD